MAKFLIIGGGLSGLSSAVFLSSKGHHVELIEASPKLGGRTYSFYYKKDEIDNGQHILLGAYRNTLEFLNIIGTQHLLDVQNKLEINFIDNNGAKFILKENSLFYPFNLISAILNFNRLNLVEKFNVIKFIIKLPFFSASKLSNKYIIDWLTENNQSENTINSLWKIISVGALNTTINYGSALLLRNTLIKIFLKGNFNYKIIIPKAGLSKLFVDNSFDFLKNNGSKVSLSERVTELSIVGESIVEVLTNKRIIKEFDFVISAIPPHAFKHLSGSNILINSNLMNSETSSITSVYIWLRKNIFKDKFYALIESPIHWLFNHGSYITLVISSSDDFAKVDNSKIKNICTIELMKYFKEFDPNDIMDLKILKEKKATTKSTPEFEKMRKEFSNNIHNLKFIGDWVNTELPMTIESAILSGKMAAESFEIKKNTRI